MSASSPHGFVVVRRGYRPGQVDGRVSDLTEERDEANERATRLTVLATELSEEAERLHHLATTLPPQTYESLGHRAREILTTAEAEAADVRSAAEAEAQRSTEQAERDGDAAGEAAREHADRTRTAADTTAARTLERARTAADELRDAARDAADEIRSEAWDVLDEMTRRCAGLLADQEKEQTTESDALDRELGARESATETHVADLDEHGHRLLAEAKRAHAEAEEAARHRQEDAEAQGAALLAQARTQEDGVERETDRVLRDHEERADELRAHMAHVRSSLAALTGRTDESDEETRRNDAEEPDPGTEAETQLPEQTNRSDH
jgi:hypothetical protein